LEIKSDSSLKFSEFRCDLPNYAFIPWEYDENKQFGKLSFQPLLQVDTGILEKSQNSQ